MSRAHSAPNVLTSDLPGLFRRRSVQLAALGIGTYLVLAAVLLGRILVRNGGHFTYALDDPYIHLALSEGIAHGHYGINPGEPASPASSVLWPFLLAIFAPFRFQVYAPLGLNVLAGIATAALIGGAVARWPDVLSPPNSLNTRGDREADRTETARRALAVVGLIFIGNLLGLTFIGMEHTLQVLLAGAGAWGLIDCLRGRPIPTWVLVCVAAGPLVRYESLGITVAVAVALCGWRQWRRAAALLAASIVPLLLFSMFLHHLGLPWLPTSVLVKGRLAASGTGLEQRSLTLAETAATGTLADPHRLILAVLFAILAGLAWQEKDRVRRFALAGATLAGGLHLLIGRFNWFHRYEVYAVFFSALVVLHAAHEGPRGQLGWFAMGLLGCSFVYLGAFLDVPRSAGDVYREQFQMHRFVTEFDVGNVAVNDLGLVSYRRPPGTYVLDLWGLGSVEAARQQIKSTAWLDAVTRAHDVDLVMDYALWFSPPPRSWRLLGEICLTQLPVALGDPCVNYYATDPGTAQDLQDEFDEFARTLPPGVLVRHPLLPPPLQSPPLQSPSLQSPSTVPAPSVSPRKP